MLALGSGPATSRSSIAPGFWPSRTLMTGRSPSNNAGWPALSVVQSVRRPSIEALPPMSTPNSVLVATDSAGVGDPVARWPAATRFGLEALVAGWAAGAGVTVRMELAGAGAGLALAG